jgi:hypothetical protein
VISLVFLKRRKIHYLHEVNKKPYTFLLIFPHFSALGMNTILPKL